MATADDLPGWYRITNPAYSGQAWQPQNRTTDLSAREGIKALWSPLAANGHWKMRLLYFDERRWGTAQQCEQWVSAHREELKSMNPTNIKAKDLQLTDPAGRAYGPTPSPEDMTAINEHALEPMQAEGVYVRRMNIANDQIDRDLEQFSRGVLNAFAETLPGKSVLVGHDTKGAPLGRFYSADVVRDPGDGTTWLRGYWYMPRTGDNEAARANIDSGVWKHASIGFQYDWLQCRLCAKDYRSGDCPHIVGQEYPVSSLPPDTNLNGMKVSEDGQMATCTLVYRGGGEALEGSIVYLGAQYNAEVAKAKMAGDFAEEKRLLQKVSPEAGADTEQSLSADVGEGSDVQLGAADGQSGGTKTAEDSEVQPMTDEEKQELEDAKAAVAAAEVEKAELVKAAEAATQRAARLRAPVVAEVEKLAGLMKREPELATMKTMAGDDLANLPDEKLLDLRDQWQKAYDATLPGAQQSTPADPGNPPEQSGTLYIPNPM